MEESVWHRMNAYNTYIKSVDYVLTTALRILDMAPWYSAEEATHKAIEYWPTSYKQPIKKRANTIIQSIKDEDWWRVD